MKNPLVLALLVPLLGSCVFELSPAVEGRWWCNFATGAQGDLFGVGTKILDSNDLPAEGCVATCPDQHQLMLDVIGGADPTPEFETLHAIAQDRAISSCRALAVQQNITDDNCEEAVIADGFPSPRSGPAGIVYWEPEACEDDGGTGETG